MAMHAMTNQQKENELPAFHVSKIGWLEQRTFVQGNDVLEVIKITTKATKVELMNKRSEIENHDLLPAFFCCKKAKETLDWAENLTSTQKGAIREGLEDVLEGRVHTTADIWKKYGR